MLELELDYQPNATCIDPKIVEFMSVEYGQNNFGCRHVYWKTRSGVAYTVGSVQRMRVNGNKN